MNVAGVGLYRSLKGRFRDAWSIVIESLLKDYPGIKQRFFHSR